MVKLIMNGMRECDQILQQIYRAFSAHPYLGLTWDRAALEPESQAEMDLNCHKIKSTFGHKRPEEYISCGMDRISPPDTVREY